MADTEMRTFVEVQAGGAGIGNWQPIDLMLGEKSGVILPSPSGGEVEYTPQYATDHEEGSQIVMIGFKKTGAPSPLTGEIRLIDLLEAGFYGLEGKFNLRTREFTGDYSDPNNYVRTRYLLGARITNPGNAFSTDLVNELAKPGDQRTRNYSYIAAQMLDERVPVLSNISGAITSLAINKIISIGYKRAAGDVPGEYKNNPGTLDYIAVTDKDASNLPHLIWTNDGFNTYHDVTLTGMTNGDAVGVTKAGAYIIVAMSGTGGGLAYARWKDIKAGTATWTRCTGISVGTAVNCVSTISPKLIYAGGNGGKIYRSTDGGFSFELFNDGVATAQNLTKIAWADQTLVWLGGAAGALVKIARGAAAAVTVTGLGTDNVTGLAVPKGRGNAIHVVSSAGDWYASDDEGTTWREPEFDGKGTGTLADIQFSGYEGQFCWLLHTNGSSQTRVLRDRSGGYGGPDVQIVSHYTDPANSGINSIAASDPTTAVCVGEIHSTKGFIGRVTAKVA